MFDTQFSRIGQRIVSVVGSGMKPTFKMHVDEDGKRELRQNGEYNLYAEIQSYKDSVSIDYILARFTNGDETALSRVQGIYGDFTEMPRTMAELQQRVIDAENLFNNLPLEMREQYNFSASEFFAQLDSDKTKALFGVKEDAKEDVKAGVVIEEAGKVVEPAQPVQNGGISNA
nr:MAG TPA: Scaffold protein [Microviridae sp.]